MSSLALLLVLAALVLPLRLHAQQRECVVAARAIARGTVLSRPDLSVVREAQCHVATLAADSLPGMVARRVIRAGEPLRAPAVAPLPAIAQGDTVEVRLVEGGVHLSLRGTVATPALTGERVWVRLGPKRRLQGVVAAPGLVVAE